MEHQGRRKSIRRCLSRFLSPWTHSKETNSDQWWELKDARTGRSYYFNATTHETKWQRPEKGDIVALARLQKMQEDLAREEANPQQEEEEEELPPPPSPQPEQRQIPAKGKGKRKERRKPRDRQTEIQKRETGR